MMIKMIITWLFQLTYLQAERCDGICLVRGLYCQHNQLVRNQQHQQKDKKVKPLSIGRHWALLDVDVICHHYANQGAYFMPSTWLFICKIVVELAWTFTKSRIDISIQKINVNTNKCFLFANRKKYV